MKNRDILLDVIGEADETLVPELTAGKKQKKHPRIMLTVIGTACAAAVIGGLFLIPRYGTPGSPGSGKNEYPARYADMLLASAAYPDMPQYPEAPADENWDAYSVALETWQAARSALRDQPEGYQEGFDVFFANSTPVFLNGAGSENRVYSPLSLYMALGMSAEITDGNTRQQILDVLAQKDLETLRTHAESVWKANYADDGLAKCVLASSLWTNQLTDYRPKTLDTLASVYYASVFSGDPKRDAYSKLMQEWINQQTDGLLADYADGIRMDPEMLLTIASTVNYSGKWSSQFDRTLTEAGTFHAPDGDVSCDFMHAEYETGYYCGEHFTAVGLDLDHNGQMRLILPDEGISPEDLLDDAQVCEYLTQSQQAASANERHAFVNMTVPKFDVSSGMNLEDGLKTLGITDIFEPDKADFSPLTANAADAENVYLSKAEQDARVLIDEAGCKAAALTVLEFACTGAPTEQYEFVLDRPFLFEIISDAGMPLFVGIVNNPAA